MEALKSTACVDQMVADYTRRRVFGSMAELRLVVDELETLVSKKHWPFPTYGELLFGVN